jgi:hypothetical protein
MGDIYSYTEGAATDSNGLGQRRHMFITSKGVLWYVRIQWNTGLKFFCSTNNGDTWTLIHTIGWMPTTSTDFSIFCDELDNIHLVFAHYAGSNDGRTYNATMYYAHGVLNATHTAITFASVYALPGSADMWHCPDLVAHEHNGKIRVHIFHNYNWSGDNRHIVFYNRIVVNINDVSTAPTHEAQVFTHDAVGVQTYPGKVSCELRHNGNGKTPQSVNGVRTPDVIYSYTSSNTLHFGRIAWAGGNTWTAPAQQFQLDTVWGNRPSTSELANNGGLNEHHRWITTLYSARDNQCIVFGWAMQAPGNNNQLLGCWEVAIGASARNVGVGVTGAQWDGSNPYNAMISGAATLDPDGNIFMVGQTHWNAYIGYARVIRPKSSLARTWSEYTHVDGDASVPSSTGCRAVLLPYPQGEQHALVMRSNNIPIHWRTNKTCNWVVDGSNGWQRRPKFRKNTDGNWVPVQTVAL